MENTLREVCVAMEVTRRAVQGGKCQRDYRPAGEYRGGAGSGV